MSSNKLSAVLEKQIRRLCLNDFPCGHGTWRKTKDGAADGAQTEEIDVLLDLLSCPHSPWRHNESWSPQAPGLRRLAVIKPECLHTDFIYKYFTALRIVDKDVSVLDDGLLKFSQLEELVLSANRISEVSAGNLPSTLKTLELCANRVSALNIDCLPPRLQYLGLGSNCLGSHDDICYLTGRHWPQLVCLDLSDCEFQDQQALLDALSTLPSLRTLVLEGNPFTLAPSYPGLTVDSLPRLSCLDASWISPEERCCFLGLAKKSDLRVNRASVTVSVGRMRGIPDPLMSNDDNTSDFHVITYHYFIAYEFLSPHTLNMNLDNESKCDTAQSTEDCFSDADQQSNRDFEKESSKGDLAVYPEETRHDVACVSRHSTSKLTWSESMDFDDAQTYIVSDLRGLKRFFNRGLLLTIEEEKVVSVPAASEDVPSAKPSQAVKEKKGGKGKESPIKSGSTKDKSKEKKKKCATKLVHNAPIRRNLGSVHVPLHSLVKGGQKVAVLCDLGTLHADCEVEAHEKDLVKKIKEDKKESKQRGGSGTKQKNTAASKGKGRKDCEMDVRNSVSVQLEPVTVEISVELEKWQSASDAHQHLLPHLNYLSKQPVLS